jgi:hypothetical protein
MSDVTKPARREWIGLAVIALPCTVLRRVRHGAVPGEADGKGYDTAGRVDGMLVAAAQEE